MQFNKHVILIFLAWAAVACRPATSPVPAPPDYSMQVPEDSLTLLPNKGIVAYRNEPFTGTGTATYPNGASAVSIQYAAGKKNGLYRKWFSDGTLSFESGYANGRQHGTTRSWWRNGNLRSESNFDMGVPDGEQKQWYESGNLFKQRSLVAGKEEGMQCAWRANGKLYINYEAKNGRIFGLRRSKLCYELDDEKIQ